ncbi:hypothetical protein ISG33_12800 [Glaciecola sp. MH2013]|uniref:hypothetical protein n=1 Tax=Glaciecola sp. MH2013 TaxID=2785524 RepID=UPI0018A09D9C|nr:hypothetical protein [Glaciecola sp. MH2013]MBF7074278.1 hypothetical protein [Glaciecola sp. MH2013]
MTTFKAIGIFLLGSIFALFTVFFADALLSDPVNNESTFLGTAACADAQLSSSINSMNHEHNDNNNQVGAGTHYDDEQFLTASSSREDNKSQAQRRLSNNESSLFQDQEKTLSCDLRCLDDLHTALLNSTEISADMLDLASDHAQEYADYLLQNPSALQTLELSMLQMNNAQDKEVIIYVLSKLPAEQLSSAAYRLSTSDNSEDRIAAVSLLEASLASGADVSGQFNLLIKDEQDEKVLIRSLQAFDQVEVSSLDAETMSRLSALVMQGDTESIRKAALFAKMNVVTNDNELRGGVFSMLDENSADLQLAGLQAMDSILARQKYRPEQGNWHNDNQVRQSINSIANNISANPQLRIEALNLLSRHF